LSDTDGRDVSARVVEDPADPAPQRARRVAPLTILAVLAIAAIWLTDVSTGPEYGFAVFYLIPIAFAAWFLGRLPGLVVAALATLAWISADIASREAIPVSASVWNGITRGVIFAALAWLIDQIRRERLALRTVNAHREESLALVAHTLRQSAEEIQAALPDITAAPLNAAERNALLRLRRQSRNFSRFAEDVLDVGQMEAGRFHMSRSHLDLCELARQIANEADAERCQLVLQSHAVWVDADADRLRTAIEHLVDNALRFSPSGSTVLVTVSDNDGHARVIVRDRGVGFAKSQIPQIFKKYGRVRTERTRDTVGVGLGLYVVRLIAEAHGGTVSAKSIGLGQGSTFTLSLPLAEAPAEAATGT